MPSTILSDNGVLSGTAGVKTTGSNDGQLDLQTTTAGGTATTAVTIDTSQNLKFNSGYGSVATAYGCRAWVNFNGTGTVAIRASGNVTSITDNGTGDYTVNFTNALPDANYSVTAQVGGTATVVSLTSADQTTARTVSTVRLYSMNTAGTNTDAAQINIAIFR